MKQQLIELLETRGFPVFLQGSLNPEKPYPESFFTFWNFETPETQFYDNESNLAIGGFWVYFYSSNPRLVESEPLEVKKLLKKKGYIVPGRGEDADSGRETHTGRMLTVYYMEV